MIALRYFCGFSLQIFPYAFFCLYPFQDRFRLSTKKAMLMALSIFIVMVIPFSLIAQFNIGGDYRELIWNVIFYIALLLFGIFYCFSIQAKAAEKLFVFFVVMSYGFFVTSTVTFLHRTFRFPSDYFMYPPFALAIRINKAGREQRIFQIRDSRSALIIVRIRSISMRNGFARSRFMISVRISARGGYIK